jgi:class 3 adenylate cyclase
VTSEDGAAETLARHYLEGSGVVIRGVESCDEAQRLLQQELPDLIVVEITSDRLAGLELCRSLKTHPETVLLPFVLMADSPHRRLDGIAAGADDFFTREVSREEFRLRIQSLLRVGALRGRASAARLEAEIKGKEAIRETFRRYVSPSLVDKILSDSGLRHTALAARNTRVRAAVLFADMRGFTRISELLSPLEVVPLLNDYFSLLTQITFQHQGTVFHMAGDCLMVGFGVPLEQPDASVRAVKAARDMLSQFRRLADTWQQRHGIETGMGIGINEGEVIAGNIGSREYMSYTIIGDTVNVASRLGQRARAGEMLFSESVKQAVEKARVDVSPVRLPPLILRGRSQPVDIYCVPIGERLDIRPS